VAIKFEKKGKEEVSIIIEGSVGVEDVLEFYIRLKESLTDTRTLTIDLSAIESMDTSVIQLILVSKNEICGRGGSFNMVNPSAELIQTLNMAGLQGELGAA
jgi:anti-anti-sigma factor